jgi:predicted NAD-dependent protein-ADP-ribosyltransferase YbiA (DUF1768 family)
MIKTKTIYVYKFQDPPTEKYPREPFEVEFNSHKAAEDYIATDGFDARFSYVRIEPIK